MTITKERVTWCASLDLDRPEFSTSTEPSLQKPVTFKPINPVRLGGPTATTRETPGGPAPDTLTPRGLHRSRRSVPSFLPSLQTQVKRHSDPSEGLLSESNVAERPYQDLPSALRPDVNSIMPSSVAYSEIRTLPSGKMDEGRPRNDDIFLNIAKTDLDRRESLGRADFKRSRLSYSNGSLRSPATREVSESTPSPDHRPNNVESPLLSQNGSSTLPYSYSPAASAHPLDESSRFRYSGLNSGARSTIGAPRSRLSRASPETSPRSPAISGEYRERRASLHESRLHRSSGLSTVRGSRQPSTSEDTERARGDTEKPRADGTESTLSTTAPSTVWDELDDLKSRIRKLELTGKLPPSSQAAISGVANERPRTAATTITAMSTSPRHHRKASSPSAETENTVQSQVHPLLQSALAKAKAVMSSDVYSALEVTITDALALSTMLGVNTAPSGSVSVVNGGYTSPERYARRKADSVCRSLTELCLALTDEELKKSRSTSSDGPAPQSQRATNGKSETELLMPTPSYQRATSQEPEILALRQSTGRIPSRLDARGASVAHPSPGSTIESKPAQSPDLSTPPSRLHRISTSLRNRRMPAEEDGAQTANPNSRSFSRAMTEIGTPSPAQNPSPRHRLSFGQSTARSISGVQQDQGLGLSPRSPQYTPSTPTQPPASQAQSLSRTPSNLSQSGIPFRRSYMTPGVYSPATSRSNIQAGSRRYGLSPNLSNNTPGSGPEEPPAVFPARAFSNSYQCSIEQECH
ncbi:uncharacterized protein N7483_000211 [Penicillium malachiteum]|uniref:uncharacterized protein n=1 Tax=Penicillium malachiteum TaxID=1324776 RepID=UPI0025495456|nr:uncharacterized protein N7483_000211 [Penicillium malachiteum]KAJ5735086.1 hypothetical protein N7483_000211 [Penicillium malachiteum]